RSVGNQTACACASSVFQRSVLSNRSPPVSRLLQRPISFLKPISFPASTTCHEPQTRPDLGPLCSAIRLLIRTLCLLNSISSSTSSRGSLDRLRRRSF